jgi:O-antigen ligase
VSDSRKVGPRAARGEAGVWPPPKDAWLPACGVGLLFAGHWFYGALLSDTSLVLQIAAAVLLGAVLLRPKLREDLLRLRGLELPALLFAAVILVALWSLTPWTPGGPNPVWAYVGAGPGASTIDKSATTIEIIKLVGLACFFLLGAATGARDERARTAIQLTLWVGVAFGIWAFIGSVSGLVVQTQGHRLEGHFLNPNTAGTFFAVLLMLALAELLRRLKTRRREAEISGLVLFAAAPLTFLVCLLDTASRGAMLAFLGAGVVFILLQMAAGVLKPSRALLALLAGVVLLLAVLWFAGDQLVDRFFQTGEASIVRTAIWKLHWGEFLKSPLFGYGLGSAETVNKTLLSASTYPVLWNIKAILNLYVQWLEEAGIVGAAPMFLCVAVLIGQTVRGALKRTRMVRLLTALLAVDAIFILHGTTDFGLEVPSMAALWAWLLGLQVSLAQGSSRR